MASITFKGLDEFGEKLRQLEEAFSSDDPLEQAIIAGADPVADAIRAGINSLPAEDFRYLRDGDKFNVLSKEAKQGLSAGFGRTPVRRFSASIDAKLGWDGYFGHPRKKYPKGIPNQLIARAIESGSSVRQKQPFVQPAVNKTRRKALKAMEKSIDETCEKIFKEA